MLIYGAQGVALGAYNSIKILFPEKEIQCFLVTKMENNASILGGIPVFELSEYVSGLSQAEKYDIEVLIGTPEAVMGIIEKRLDEVGLCNHVRLDSIRWGKMQEMAFVKSGEFMPLTAYPVGCRKPEITIYKMIHEKNEQLESVCEDKYYTQQLQVGAALTNNRIASLQDCSGVNISEKNGNYSELTGLYWMWKNQIKHKERNYYGLAHYRRFFDLSEDDLYRLQSNEIDVVLPYPMPYEPTIEAHHERYLTNKEWRAVLQAVEELHPEYISVFNEILKQGYLYNYNIILARESVLDEYCSWLFPLLFRIEQINDPNDEKKANRFIGYVGETLETLYFMRNKKSLRIAHTTCRFLI